MTLKTLVALTGIVLTLPAWSQDAMPPLPPQFKALDYMVGHWEGEMTMTMGPGVETKFKAVIDCEKVLGGRYVRGMHKYSVEGGQSLTGMMMYTYDEGAKGWSGWWFDSTTPMAMDMSGQMAEDALVLTSKPVDLPGTGPSLTRSTWTKVSETEMKLRLEMQQGQEWVVFMQADYTKK